jgi:hypothetical protein
MRGALSSGSPLDLSGAAENQLQRKRGRGSKATSLAYLGTQDGDALSRRSRARCEKCENIG